MGTGSATKPGKKGGKAEGTKKKGVRKAVNLSGNILLYKKYSCNLILDCMCVPSGFESVVHHPSTGL